MSMFEKYGHGDLVQYLESKGFFVSSKETVEDLRVAATLDHQARAFRRSQLVRDVAVNAERMMRMGVVNGPLALRDTLDQTCDEHEEDETEVNPFFGW